jgi:hypothetical protein
VVFSAAVESTNVVTFAPTLPASVQGPDAEELRSIRKPDSLKEPSVHVARTWVGESGVAVRPDGAIGTVCGVLAETIAEGLETSEFLKSRKR